MKGWSSWDIKVIINVPWTLIKVIIKKYCTNFLKDINYQNQHKEI